MSIILGPIRPDLLREETLAMLFRASAAERPSKAVMIFGDRTLTYAQLDRWTDAVAAFLLAQGIGRGASVGLWWSRGIELHVAIF